MTKEQIRMLADRKYQTKLESDAFVSGWEYSQTNTKMKDNSQYDPEVLKIATIIAVVSTTFMAIILLLILKN